MAAYEAHAQRDPRVTGFQAFFATIRAWSNILDLIGVGTGLAHIIRVNDTQIMMIAVYPSACRDTIVL